MLHVPALSIHLALLAAVIGALDGGYGLLHPRGSARASGVVLAEGTESSALRAQAGARLLAHAAVVAALMSSPAVGACVAAGVGSSWLGASCGRAVGALASRRGRGLDLLRMAGATAMGLALWWPLWSYLRLLKMIAQGVTFG